MPQLTNQVDMTLADQFSDASGNGLLGNYNLGFDFDIDETQYLPGGIRYGMQNFKRKELGANGVYMKVG